MFIELVDGLRCTSDHRSICLVAAITKRDDRHIVEGVLGCPTCGREYPIRDGIAWFGARADPVALPSHEAESDPEEMLRAAALLGVSDGITIALVGRWGSHASALTELVGLRAFAVNPGSRIEESERVAALYSDNRLPFRDASLQGIAVDDSGWSGEAVALATRALAPGGRLVAPSSVPVPRDIDEIARDDAFWVGEMRGPLVGLHRR